MSDNLTITASLSFSEIAEQVITGKHMLPLCVVYESELHFGELCEEPAPPLTFMDNA